MGGIGLLGPLRVDGGETLEPRDRVVLSVLAVRRGNVVSPEEFAEALWGDRPPSSWPKQVQICIGRLRKVLGAGAIETVAGGYRLALNGDEVDGYEFELLIDRARVLRATGQFDRAAASYARALALWRGRPLDELDGWLPGQSEAARFEELRRTAEEDWLDCRLAAGEHREVAAEAQALVTAEPLRERRWAILALAQYRCGRQGDALRSLTRARRTLVDELGIDPGPDLVALEEAILRQDPDLSAVPEAAAASEACPYKGLASYDVGDEESFFGRDAEIAACLERLRSTPLLVVAGPSGCGKSSLVRAGLVPALRRRGQTTVVFVPGTDPDGAMDTAIAGVEGPAVLVIDQFEELLALGHPPEVIRGFCRRIGEHASEVAAVIMAVRSDHVGGLGTEPGFSRLAERGLHLVTPLAGDALRESIEQPAELARLRLEHGLVELLVRDCEGEPGGLPLLSHALAETWRRRDGNVLTVEGYRATGGIRGAVARSADRLYDTLPGDQRAVLRGVLLRLVTPTLDGDPVRCRVSSRSLLGDRNRERIVGLLVRARLVTSEEDTFELAHEALARAWPRLQSWLDDDIAGQRLLRHLTTAAEGWESLGRPVSELYRGGRLDTALEWREASQPDLTELEQQFLTASVDHATSETRAITERARRDASQNRRLRSLLGATALFLVVSMVVGYVAVAQRGRAEDEADQAEAAATAAMQARLVGDAERLAPTDRDLAMLLAVEANRRDAGAAGAGALATALFADPSFLRYVGDPNAPVSTEAIDYGSRPAFSPDSSSLAIPDTETGEIRIVDVVTGREERTLDLPALSGYQIVYRIDWLPSGVLLVSGEDEVVGVDAEDGVVLIPRTEVDGWIASSAVSPDGRLAAMLIAGEPAATVMVLELPSGRELLRQRAPCCWANVRVGPARFPFIANGVVAWRGDELYVASGTGTIEAWAPRTGQLLRRLGEGFPPTALSLAVSQDGDRLYVSGADEAGDTELMAYDAATGRPLWPGPQPEAGLSLAVDPRHDAVISADTFRAGPARRFDGDTGQPTGDFDLQAGGQCDVSVSPNGRYLVTGACSSAVTGLWSLAGEGAARRFVLDGEHEVTWANRAGTYAALGDPGGPLELDVATGETTPIELPPGFTPSIAGAPEGRVTLITPDRRLASSVDEVVRPSRPFAIGRLGVPLPADPISSAVDDDTAVVLDVAGALTVYSAIEDGVPVEDADGSLGYDTNAAVSSVVLSPSGNRVYAAGTSGVVVYDLDRYGVAVDRSPGFRLALDADHERLAVAELEGTVTIYDAETLTPLGAQLTGPFAAGLAFLDDSTLLTADAAMQLHVYDVDEGVPIGEGIDIGEMWRELPERRSVLAQPDGALVEITLDPSAWMDLACLAAGRNLSLQEWDTYVGGPPRATCPQWPAPA